MQLSIVECSDYRHCDRWQEQILLRKKINPAVETIGPVKGPSVSVMRNRGAIEADGHWLFFKDQDCQVNYKNLLNRIAENEKQAQPFDVLGGIYKNSEKSFLSKVYSSIQRRWVLSGLLEKKSDKFRSGEKVLGGALLVRKTVWQQCHGFSEEIGWGAEEVDFIQRAKRQGFKVGVSFRMVVGHRNPMPFAGFMKRAWKQNFNRSFFTKNENGGPGKSLHYFKTNLRYWPSLILFFTVASVASSAGFLARKVVIKWN